MSTLTSPASSRTASPGPQLRARANRAALRQYYGLKEASGGSPAVKGSPSLQSDHDGDVIESELDGEAFDAELFVRKTLDTKQLDEILKLENRLISEIRSLDGEKKALVYDNYSKLISATDTIRKMRDNMAPLTPEDSALNEDIARIASLSEDIAKRSATQRDIEKAEPGERVSIEGDKHRLAQVNTVKWVLDAPTRLSEQVKQGKTDEAQEEWREVQNLLEAWKGVKGAADVEKACRAAMQHA